MSHESVELTEEQFLRLGEDIGLLSKYISECAAATIEIIDGKTPSVCRLQDLEPMLERYFQVANQGSPTLDQPVQSLVALITKGYAEAYALIRNRDLMSPLAEDYLLVKVGLLSEPKIVDPAKIPNIRIENGVLVVSGDGIDGTKVYTRPQPSSQTGKKQLHSAASRKLTLSSRQRSNASIEEGSLMFDIFDLRLGLYEENYIKAQKRAKKLGRLAIWPTLPSYGAE